MPQFQIIDAYSHFPEFWEKIKYEPLDTQISLWESEYLTPWPDLKEKLISNVEEDGPWQEITKKYVFPKFQANAEYFFTGGNNLKSILPEIVQICRDKFDITYDLIAVIYVGIGVGAGWATTFRDTPAILFGLENMIECGWLEPETLKGLTAHEIGHIIHYKWRKNHEIEVESTSPLWQLYEEGFAMRLEHEIMGYNSWHEQVGQKNWVFWCTHNIGRLASRFLKTYQSEKQEVIHKFFGSWYEIEGQKQTGYFLGHQIIKELEKNHDLREIAMFQLDEIEVKVKNTLQKIAET